MGIEYKKTKDRLIFPRGPRDIQRRQCIEAGADNNQVELLESLRAQIRILQKQLESGASITNDQLDAQIITTVKEETIKYKEYINELELENNKLKDTIKNKEGLIEQLKQIKSVATESHTYDEVEIEPVFIDPIEKDFVPLKTNIDIGTSLTVGKKSVSNKVNKLKELLGKK